MATSRRHKRRGPHSAGVGRTSGPDYEVSSVVLVVRMGLYYTFFVIPVILPFYFWDKTRQERMIAGSNVEWGIA